MYSVFQLVAARVISPIIAEEHYELCMASGKEPIQYFSDLGFIQSSGKTELDWVLEAAEEKGSAPRIDEVMKLSGGCADPRQVRRVLHLYDFVNRESTQKG